MVSIAVVAYPPVPVAVSATPLAWSLNAVVAVVGLALLRLQVLRFNVLGSALDLLFGLGFGICAVTSLLVGVVVSRIGSYCRYDG